MMKPIYISGIIKKTINYPYIYMDTHRRKLASELWIIPATYLPRNRLYDHIRKVVNAANNSTN